MDAEALITLIALLSLGLGSAAGSAATLLTQALIRKHRTRKDEDARLPSKLEEILDRIGDRLESLVVVEWTSVSCGLVDIRDELGYKEVSNEETVLGVLDASLASKA